MMASLRRVSLFCDKISILQKDGRVVFLTSSDKGQDYYNIPIANTTVLLLGMGTSITQRAVRMLASAGVIIGFCGTGGTPLLAGTEMDLVWMYPQSEYRITKFIQGWQHFWYDDAKRLEAAKIFQRERIAYLQTVWSRDAEGKDPIIGFLTHGNYLAYGLGATCCWVLGLSHAFPVMHGKTRRGGLVFDTADLIKDILVLPFAFIRASEGLSRQEFRENTIQRFLDYDALGHLFDVVESVALKWPWEGNKGVDDHAGNLFFHELETSEARDGESP